MPPTHPVYLEIAPKRTFASAVDWPGWTRSGKTPEQALDTLVRYGDRYARVARGVGGFAPPSDVSALEVVARLDGNATTEFGAPGIVPPQDERALDAIELERQSRLLQAAWQALDAAAAAAEGAVLRRGPRGGGRDLPKILEHVASAESGAYLAKLGGRPPKAASTAALRERILEVLAARAHGTPISDPSGTRSLWPPRYFVRRAAWHVLDHAWEAEDRAE